MALTLTGFVFDNAGNAIPGATVQGYVTADDQTSGTTAGDPVLTDANGKWAITTSDVDHIPMDVRITYGSSKRWIKAGDKLNVTDLTVSGKLTVGENDTGYDVQLHGATSGRSALWDESEDAFQLNDNTELKFGSLLAGDMVLYHDGSDSYIKNATGALKLATESTGIAVTIGHTTSEVTIGENLTATGTITGTVLTATTNFTMGDTVVTNGVITDATGLSLAADVTITGDLIVSGDTITVNTSTLTVEDPLIALATGNSAADVLDIGIYGLYDTSGSLDLYAGLFRDADDDGKWKLFKDSQAVPTTTVNTSGTGYAVGTLVATLEGNVTGALTGNADTVTTNANLTGMVTSSGNAASLGAFTKAELTAAVSDGVPLFNGDLAVGPSAGFVIAMAVAL